MAVQGVEKPVEPAASKGSVSIRLPEKVYRRFFANVVAKDVEDIVEEAWNQHYVRKGAWVKVYKKGVSQYLEVSFFDIIKYYESEIIYEIA